MWISSFHAKRVVFVAIALCVVACERAPSIGTSPSQSEAPRNVVWIVLDACRADHLSCYGYHRPTSPNIDALAARGVLFERNYAQGPNTPQSVQNYMTGRYSAVGYHYPGAMGDWFLRKPLPTESLVSTIFRENGYETAMFSASPWYTAESRLARSFDHFQPLHYGEQAPGGTWRERNPELFDWIAQPRPKPFFLYIHSLDTHGPRYTNNTATTWLDPAFPAQRDAELRAWDDGNFTAADQQRISDLYDGGVQFADASVGEILAALDDAGLTEDTLVVLGSDHGELLGEDGHTVSHPPRDSHDDVLHVPLLLAGPGVPAGVRVNALAQNADIVPTLVGLFELQTSATFDGRSLAPIMSGGHARLHEYAVARTQGESLSAEPGRVILFDDVKFDFSPNAGRASPEAHADPPDEAAYAMPDRAGARRPISPDASQRSRALTVLHDTLLPSWQSVEAQPVEVPPWFRLQLGRPYDRSVATDDPDPRDGKWTRKRSRFATAAYHDVLYVAHPATEPVPALLFARPVPNGEYYVAAYCATQPADPPRGASFSYTIPAPGATARIVGLPAPAPGTIAEAWLELGTVRVTDGQFALWVDPGNPEDDAVIGHLIFRTSSSAAPIESFDEQRERMEALGYAE